MNECYGHEARPGLVNEPEMADVWLEILNKTAKAGGLTVIAP
jgi:hypothetical protein